ncbi:hypothetical protein [Catenuloplanes indicus]|uniref:Uncharacterized protein n=1 Tax=Catenuloplanes indicus TaxID=137267 RepID=A0AAE3VX70_9ACTN|nr:hypothetical protein [Catenuloplanes indicus]MDQ0364942.1 hypothetical protein [Catenuloplanes indicus]
MSSNFSEAAILRRIDHVGAKVEQVDQGLIAVSAQVGQVGQRADETQTELRRLAADFQRFVLDAQRTANVQRAETRVGVVEAQIEHQFGHHNVVRRTATGMLQGFDVGLVSEETVRAVSEQLMVQNPRYWLAPVLVALGAWAADEPELCERAVQEGFRRSPGRTSLFMALVLRRQGRREASVRWLRHYLAAQDPTALGRDFAMILECVSQGAFGPAGVDLVRERLDAWRARLLDDDARQDAQVTRWRAELDRYIAGSSGQRFPFLAGVSPQWPQMDRALSCAAANGALIDTYRALAAETPTPAAQLEDQVDDILDRLVREYDEEELPLRREHAQARAIIRHNGDINAAQRDLATDLTALERTLDYLTIQSESALNPAAIGVSRSTQRMAVSSCHEWFARAHGMFSRDYRAALPTDVHAVFQGNHNAAGVVFQLPRWTGSFTRPVPDLERDLAAHWDRAAAPFIASLGWDWRRQGVGPLIGIVAAALVVMFCLGQGSPLLGVLAGAMIGGGGALFLWSRQRAGAKRQQEAREVLERGKYDSIRQLRAAGAELVDWNTAFRAADGREPEVRAMIADLATIGSPASPYERRVAENGATR